MEDKRAETLQALSTFIEKQKALLTKTQADIARLNELKDKVAAQPEEFADNLSEELDDGAFRLSELEESVLNIPKEIDWSLYAKSDPTPFRTLRNETQKKRLPSLTSTSGLSDLQKLVREARTTILDPIFTKFNLSFHPTSESGEEEANDHTPVDPAEVKKAKEREKIKELKKRKIVSCGLTVSSPPGHRARGPGGVFIRRDLVDESMDVEISAEDDTVSTTSTSKGITTNNAAATSTSTSATRAVVPPPPIDSHNMIAPPRSTRPRRPTTQVSMSADTTHAHAQPLPPPLTTRRKSSRARASSSCVENHPSIDMDLDLDQSKELSADPAMAMDTDPPLPPTPISPLSVSSTGTPAGVDTAFADGLPSKVLGKRARDEENLAKQTVQVGGKEKGKEGKEGKGGRKSGKPKPETYKQAWSVSEQHLLEKLLQEIPEGEKNRWKKISIAMNGRRTPRQVASRVQKYFEKLKRFGISIDD